MPVILAPQNYARWLDAEEQDPIDLLRAYPHGEMAAYPVSTVVNSPMNDAPGLIEPLALVNPPDILCFDVAL